MSSPIDDFDDASVTATARRVLTERQYVIWLLTDKHRWRCRRIVAYLRLSHATVERELHKARLVLREALAESTEGPVRFEITIRAGRDTFSAQDSTPAAAAHSLDRRARRQGRLFGAGSDSETK